MVGIIALENYIPDDYLSVESDWPHLGVNAVQAKIYSRIYQLKQVPMEFMKQYSKNILLLKLKS